MLAYQREKMVEEQKYEREDKSYKKEAFIKANGLLQEEKLMRK